MSLAQRSVTSTAWNVVSNMTRVVVLFLRSVLLARLLPVEVFGVYGGAAAVIAMTGIAVSFGTGGAFLHRTTETEDEDHAAAVLFTLRIIFTLVWAALLTAATLWYTEGETRVAMLLLTFTAGGIQLTRAPRLILIRRVVHRRLALLQLLNAVLTTLVAVGLAWRGVTLWALLATDVVTLLLTILMLYVWRPVVWRPHLAWDGQVVRYYLSFGSRNFVAAALQSALNRVDDLWTRFYLGTVPMGFYSRAYTFATYPRTILAGPLNTVSGGTYAELKGDRLHLSQAFFRINALLVRSGFLLAGLLALVAPEFIRLVIGVKWLPMLDAFRLMLAFTLFDPIKVTIANLFIAVGKPEQIVRARLVQLAVLLVGLGTLGPRWGIVGVALAVDVMLVVGIAILLYRARAYVDFALTRLFAAPAIGLVLGLLIAWGASLLPPIAGNDWLTGGVKSVLFGLVYGAVLLLMERQQVFAMFTFVLRALPLKWSQHENSQSENL